MELDFLHQRAHLCPLAGVARQQRRADGGFLETFQDDASLVDETEFGFQARHLAARAPGQKFRIPVEDGHYEFEGKPLLQQRQTDHIHVVADGEPVEFTHVRLRFIQARSLDASIAQRNAVLARAPVARIPHNSLTENALQLSVFDFGQIEASTADLARIAL
jgi:hypothetical protein